MSIASGLWGFFTGFLTKKLWDFALSMRVILPTLFALFTAGIGVNAAYISDHLEFWPKETLFCLLVGSAFFLLAMRINKSKDY
jgi:hypothetical protein